MILCLDVGNTQIFGGILENDRMLLSFRHSSQHPFSADQFGVFLRSVLRENQITHDQIEQFAICSVVPHLDYTLTRAAEKYFSIKPFFLQAGVKTGLKINYRNPLEVGADRIANAMAGVELFPQKNILIIDFGTATTLCAITAQKTFLGGVILAGMPLCMKALQNNTAKLSSVEIIQPTQVLGRSTTESIQSGLYYSQLATLKYISKKITQEQFEGQQPVIIGTGGFAHLFQNENVFDVLEPDLVLHGLRLVLQMNPPKESSKIREIEHG